jgi:cytochrome c peroxidase
MPLVLRSYFPLLLCALGCSTGEDEPASTCPGTELSASHCERAQRLALPATLPAARGNQYGDDETAAQLGFRLFFSTELGSGTGCPACHLPELAFTDRLSVSVGKGPGRRNAPTTFNVAYMSVIFWDGSADSVWSQPLFAIENPDEMNSSRLELSHLLAGTPEMRDDYERVFGALPDMSEWPRAGKPGDPAFDGLEPDVQDLVNRVAANAGKAFEAYERKNTTGQAPLDHFLAGDESQMIPSAQRGLRVFLQQQCDSCHSGPLLSDERFHDVGFPSLSDALPDGGRANGLAVLRANIFNLDGPYADPGPGVPGAAPEQEAEFGSFRTPSLRNVTRTAPYGHDGAIASLGELLDLHSAELSSDERGDLLAFFQTLNGEYPPPPWNDWPSSQ